MPKIIQKYIKYTNLCSRARYACAREEGKNQDIGRLFFQPSNTPLSPSFPKILSLSEPVKCLSAPTSSCATRPKMQYLTGPERIKMAVQEDEREGSGLKTERLKIPCPSRFSLR